MLLDLLHDFKKLIFPSHCLNCRKFSADGLVCLSCANLVVRNSPPFCLKCSQHLALASPDGICPDCATRRVAFNKAWAACLYEEPVRHLLHQFKYNGKTGLRKIFSRWMIDFVREYHIPIGEYDVMLPMPTDPLRLRERGYNQAELLAEILAQEFNIPLRTNIIQRHKITQPQSALSPKQRFTNLQGAFKINHSSVRDKSIIIVDDLLTTGATAHAAAETLLNEGAAQVNILTLAIAPTVKHAHPA